MANYTQQQVDAYLSDYTVAQIDAFVDSQPQGWLQQDISDQIIAMGIGFIVIETVATLLRTFARRYLRQIPFGRADILALLSLLSNLMVCTSVMLTTRWGAGEHIFVVPTADLKGFWISCDFVVALAYLFGVTFPKLAVLDLYLHVFVKKWTRYTTYTLIVVMSLNLVANLPTVLAACVPFQAQWDASVGTCIEMSIYWAIGSLINILTDLVMFILPIPMVLTLQATRQEKFTVMLIFMVGSLGLVISIVRFVEFVQFGVVRDTIEGVDTTWYGTNALMWTIAEPGVYHLAACGISMRPLVAWLMCQRPFAALRSQGRTHHESAETSTGGDGPRYTNEPVAASTERGPMALPMQQMEQEEGIKIVRVVEVSRV